MCQERTLEEQVCYLRRENEVLRERINKLESINSVLVLEASTEKKHPLFLVEGGEITIIG